MSVTRAIPNPNETFSELCSDILAIVRDEEQSCSVGDPMDQYYGFGAGPKTTWPLRRYRIRVVGRLARSRYTLRKFVAELRRRTNDRWVHFGPFSSIEDFTFCLEDLNYNS